MKNQKENIELSKRVKIVGTGTSEYMPSGTAYEVHPMLGKELVNAGKATYAKKTDDK